jgi:aryl-alcohol dehydrogenase-like predicted oxidoreductase
VERNKLERKACQNKNVGFFLPGGEQQSERVIGEWLRERGTRDQIVLSTKGADPRLESLEVLGLSKTEMQADLYSSLQSTLKKIPADTRVRVLFDHQENRDRFQRLRHLQQKYGFSVGQIVLGYLLNQPFPVVALIGPKTLADLKDSLNCADAKLSSQDIDYLEHGDA